MPNYTRTPERELPLNPRLPLLGIPNQRGGEANQDSRLVNGYAEQGLDGRWHVFKRPGLQQFTKLNADGMSGIGMWLSSEGTRYSFWRSGGNVVMFRGTANQGVVGTYNGLPFQFVRVFSDATTFADVATDGNIVLLLEPGPTETLLQLRGTVVVQNGDLTNADPNVNTVTAGLRKYSQIAGTGVPADTEIEAIVDATNLTMTQDATATGTQSLTFTLSGPPAGHTTIAQLNRRLFAVDNYNAVYGTDVDDPLSWDWLNVIYAYARAEPARAIATQLSTIVVFKQTTTEFFRDQGTTPAPLGRVEGLFLDVGLAYSQSLVEIDDTLLWSAEQKSGLSSVWAMTKLGAKEISNPSVRRVLNANRNSVHYGMAVAINGHSFYVLAIDGVPAQVYDITTGLWYQWTALGEADWPFRDACMNSAGQVTLQHRSDGYIYTMDPEYTDDDGDAFNLDIYPPSFDGGTRLGKYLNRMHINADQQPGSELLLRVADEVEGDAEPRWSDFRRFDLGHSRPTIYDCGTFTKRNFHFRHPSKTPCHLHEVELVMQTCLV